MDKKAIIGLLLIFAVFIGYSFYTSHTAKKAREEQIAQQMKEEAQKKANDKKTAQLADTLAKDTSALAVDTPKVAAPTPEATATAKKKSSPIFSYTARGRNAVMVEKPVLAMAKLSRLAMNVHRIAEARAMTAL